MTDRPTCGTCPHYVPHNGVRGSCRANPPGLLPIVKLTMQEAAEDRPARLDAKAKTSSYAFWPSVPSDEPCCRLHPGFETWAVKKTASDLAASNQVPAREPGGEDDHPF